MKKVFLVAVFAVGALVGTAWAQTMCLFPSGDCWPYSSATQCNSDWGWVFNGGTEGTETFCAGGTCVPGSTTNRNCNEVPTGILPILGCCLWASSGSYDNVRLAQGASDCNGGLNTWWQGIECGPAGLDDQLTRPNATPTFDGSGQAILGYCKWPVNDDGSPNTAGDCWPVTTSGEAADCESGEGEWWPGNNWTIGSQTGACPTGPSPIVSGSTVANLNILVQTGSLHISSAREATMQLFDMSGKQVFSQKVPSGYSVVNLKDQKMGVYFAVVTSGSHKQTVKVTLK